MKSPLHLLCWLALLVVGSAPAQQLAPAPPAAPPLAPFAATGTIQYAFPPHDSADRMIIEAIDGAREQILVQAFSFTHRRIADALVRARNRGVDVRLIADYEQTRQIEHNLVRDVARAGVPVLIDSQHASAHSKIMVIDGARANCAVITGSFNFTFAAQHRNAENALILRGNPQLCLAYRRNWDEHRVHSLPYRR